MGSIPPAAAFYTVENYGADGSVGYLMRRVVTVIRQGVDRRLEAVGLTDAQWVPLLKLKFGGATPVAELARGCEVDAGAMTRMLDRLEAKGLGAPGALDGRPPRRHDRTDGRGARAAAQIPAVLCEVHNALLAGVDHASGRRCSQRCARCSTTLSPVLPPGASRRVAPMPPPRRFLPALLAPLGAAFVLAGCVSSAGIEPRAAPLAAAAVGITASAPEADVGATWWTAFEAPELDTLVQSALAANPGLKVARDRVERARAAVDAAQANLQPRVDGALDLTRQRYTENGLVPPPIAGSVGNTTCSTSAAAGDRLLRQERRRAGRGDRQLNVRPRPTPRRRRCCLRAGRRDLLQLARLFEQRDVAERALAQRGEILALVRQRVDANLDTNVELRQSEAAVPGTVQQIEGDRRADRADPPCAGRAHGAAADALDALSPRLRGSVRCRCRRACRRPARPARRRRNRAASGSAATQDVAYARTLLYPNVNLVAFVGLSSLGVNRLLNSGSERYSAGAAIRLPIFDAGRLRANVQGKIADLDTAVDSYNATLIDAVRDAADRSPRCSRRRASNARRPRRRSPRERPRPGDAALPRRSGNLPHGFSAENNVLAQPRLGADLKARALDGQVGLARALGGGYVARATDVAPTR